MTPREGVCQHGWRGQPPERGERIVTPCPACGSQSLFIGTGGHLTCSVVPSGLSSGCPNPSVEDAINALRDAARCHAATPHPAATAREEAWKAMVEALEIVTKRGDFNLTAGALGLCNRALALARSTGGA